MAGFFEIEQSEIQALKKEKQRLMTIIRIKDEAIVKLKKMLAVKLNDDLKAAINDRMLEVIEEYYSYMQEQLDEELQHGEFELPETPEETAEETELLGESK